MGLVDRENEILSILGALVGSVEQLLVVGGYAVSALSRHRFSVDCDLVARGKDMRTLEAVLGSRGFSKAQERAGLDRVYGGRFVRYLKSIEGLPVSMDLLVEALVCRDTGASWGFDYVAANSVGASVPGIQSSVRCRIPSRELLLAFKLHSARKGDVRDIVMLSEEADWGDVAKHMQRGDLARVRKQLSRVLGELDDRRLVDSLKGVFSMRENVRLIISKTGEKVRALRLKLEEEKPD